MPRIFDTLTASHLLNENLPENGLKFLTKLYLNKDVTEYEDAIKYGRHSKEFAEYATEDAINTFLLYQKFRPEIAKQGLSKLFWDVEMPFQYALMELAINGIKGDVQAAKKMKEETQHLYYQLEDEMLKLFGKEYDVGITPRGRKVFAKPQINFNSGQQVAECLQRLGISLIDKNKKGNLSTKTNVLEKLRDSIKRQLNETNVS